MLLGIVLVIVAAVLTVAWLPMNGLGVRGADIVGGVAGLVSVVAVVVILMEVI